MHKKKQACANTDGARVEPQENAVKIEITEKVLPD
jgi:hypothetical protein